MASKLVPADPAAATVIRSITSNITTLSAPFARVGLLKVGSRGTIVRLSNGSLLVFSPVALTAAAREAVNGLGGNVQYLVAPDMEHHIFLSDWHKAFPQAAVLGPDGLPQKRDKDPATRGVPFKYVWSEQNKTNMRVDEAFDRDFDVEFVGAHTNKELVLNYRPDKTLLEADLIWNLPATEQYSRVPENAGDGIFSKIFNAILNTQGAAKAQRRFNWYAASASNRPSYNASVQRISSWDFNRIIPCHGDVIETNGKGIFDKMMEWHLHSKTT